MGLFDISNEASDALITTQKTSTLCNVSLLKNSRKTTNNENFFLKNYRFWVVFLCFLRNGTLERV